MEPGLADWYRITLIVLTGFVIIVLLAESLWAWKHLSIGQKLWVTGTLFVLLYGADTLREAVVLDVGFRWKIIPYLFGLVAFFAYLLEPTRSKLHRLGGGIFDPHDTRRAAVAPDKETPPEP